MCTPWTLSKLIRCRPCFSRYDSPSSGAESVSETVPSAVATNASNRSIVDRKATRGMVFGREPVDATPKSTEIGLPNRTRKYELHWHRGFEDEHYIVLCFGEEESVNREDDSDDLNVPSQPGNDPGELNTDSLEDEDKDSSVGSTRTECHAKGEKHIESSPTDSDQSEGSNGHGSKGSFSFPVLHKEWIGSPVQMPRPEDLYLRNNSGTHVCVHCCKF